MVENKIKKIGLFKEVFMVVWVIVFGVIVFMFDFMMVNIVIDKLMKDFSIILDII